MYKLTINIVKPDSVILINDVLLIDSFGSVLIPLIVSTFRSVLLSEDQCFCNMFIGAFVC